MLRRLGAKRHAMSREGACRCSPQRNDPATDLVPETGHIRETSHTIRNLTRRRERTTMDRYGQCRSTPKTKPESTLLADTRELGTGPRHRDQTVRWTMCSA